jgi:hypothetical protein
MTTLSKAVFVAYPNVVKVSSEGTFASLLAHDVNDNVIALDETIVTNALATLQSEYEAQQQAQAQNKQNALAKLAALGLTADEISALTQ